MKARWIGLGIGAALCLAACGDAARPAVVEGSASPADGMAGAGVVAAATAPYARAERALAAGRILAPAGDNAIEHYLDACAQPSERVRAQAALAELQPYVLIAAEQAIARGDGREAARLHALIARIDPASGRVTGWIDLTALAIQNGDNRDSVLNGIAWDAEGKRLFVTGKYWPTLYEIALADCR